jgi:hypothetical protein
MADEAKSLEMRLTRLENAISKLAEANKAMDISADEMKTYLKVRSVMDVDYCGINDCMPLRCVRCIPVRCSRCIPVRCINECICGPCAGGGFGGSFGEIGG